MTPWPSSIQSLIINPLMLTVAKIKQSNFFDGILQAKAKFKKYLKEKCQSEHNLQLFFKYFVKAFSTPKLLSKVSSIQTTIPRWILKYIWVKQDAQKHIKACLPDPLSQKLNNNPKCSSRVKDFVIAWTWLLEITLGGGAQVCFIW